MVCDFLALLLFVGLDVPLESWLAAPIGDEVLYYGEKFPTPVSLPCICPFSWLDVRTCWLDLKPGWLSLKPSWLSLKPSWLALRPVCPKMKT